MSEIPKIHIGLQKAPFSGKNTTKPAFEAREESIPKPEGEPASEKDIQLFNDLREKLSEIDPSRLTRDEIQTINGFLSQQFTSQDRRINVQQQVDNNVNTVVEQGKSNEPSFVLNKQEIARQMFASMPTATEIMKYQEVSNPNVSMSTKDNNTRVRFENIKSYMNSIMELVTNANTNTRNLEFAKIIEKEKLWVTSCFRSIWDVNQQKARNFAQALGLEIFHTNEEVDGLVKENGENEKIANKRFINPTDSIWIDTHKLIDGDPNARQIIMQYVTYPGLKMQYQDQDGKVRKFLFSGYSGIISGPEIHRKAFDIPKIYSSFQAAEKAGVFPKDFLDKQKEKSTEIERKEENKKINHLLKEWQGIRNWPLVPEKLNPQKKLTRENVIAWLSTQIYFLGHTKELILAKMTNDGYSEEESQDHNELYKEYAAYVRKIQSRAFDFINFIADPEGGYTDDMSYFSREKIPIQNYLKKAWELASEEDKKKYIEYKNNK